MAIDAAMGFIPCSTPLESQTQKISVTSGQTVYKGQVVKLVAGAVLPHGAGNSGVDIAGVCMEHATGIADLSVKVTVIVDPSFVYRVLSTATVQAGDYGFFGDMDDNSGTASTGLAAGTIDDASFSATPLVALPFQHLGLYDVVSDEPNTWVKVRISHTLFSDRFGLAS